MQYLYMQTRVEKHVFTDKNSLTLLCKNECEQKSSGLLRKLVGFENSSCEV